MQKWNFIKERLYGNPGNINNTVMQYIAENYIETPRIYFENIGEALRSDNIRIRLFKVNPIEENELNIESGLHLILQFFNNKNVLCFEIENTFRGQGYNMNTLPGIIKPKFDFKYNFIGKDL